MEGVRLTNFISIRSLPDLRWHIVAQLLVELPIVFCDAASLLRVASVLEKALTNYFVKLFTFDGLYMASTLPKDALQLL